MMLPVLLESLGPLSIAVVLIVLGLLSKRLGTATRAKPQYVGFYAAAALVLISVAARVLNAFLHWVPYDTTQFTLEWALIFNGLPAIGVTLGVIFSWRYWSWLLAERN